MDEPTFSRRDLIRKEALEQAVVWAASHAHAVRHEPPKVVEAALAFEEFLSRPEESTEPQA